MPAAPIVVMLALLAGAYAATRDRLPPEQGEHGMNDSELYDAIIGKLPTGGNIMRGMTFAQAVNTDPRRIEALLMQRIIQPMMLSIGRLHSPGVPMDQIEWMARKGYLQTMATRRASGGITAPRIAASLIDAWQKASEILIRASDTPRFAPLATTLKGVVLANMADINRAFREAEQICRRAQSVASRSEDKSAYGKMCAMLDSMKTGLIVFAARGKSERIDGAMGLDEMAEDIAKEGFGAIEREDLFGAYSLDDRLEDIEDEYGRFAFEEYILSGHRAPAVGLNQFRRMGGRFY
jgi:hypothetical protein